MNFIRNSFSSSSLMRRRALPNANRDEKDKEKQLDHDIACFETYQQHWQQLEDAMNDSKKSSISEDRVLTVESHMEHIISLLNNELERSKDSLSASACLDHFLKNHILSKVCDWFFNALQDELSAVVVRGINSLLAVSQRKGKDLCLLRNPSIHQPISKIFKKYEQRINSDKCIPVKVESILVSLSYHVSILIVREPSFLDLFYDIATVANQPKFPLMSLLVNNLHKNGIEGQISRDSLKLLMSLDKEQQLLAQYIAIESNFCPIVATGLSAVFSDLPRLLPPSIEEIGMISMMDIEHVKEIDDFVTTLEFCDTILESASWIVVNQLLEYCYNGFLVPVLSPALFQNTMREILASTCYLTLCLRRIRNRGLIGIFVRFLLTHTHEGSPVIDALINRLSAQTELRLATLQFFHALVDLNCEDVMLVLVMQHLIPCKHVMVSQRGGVLQENDTNCLWAAKLLSLIPSTCNLPLQKGFNSNMDYSSSENEPDSRIRSWSKTSNESISDSRYGQLAFTPGIKSDSNEQILSSDCAQSAKDAMRLKNYLIDCNMQICSSVAATSNWTYLYDGQQPSIKDAVRMSSKDQSLPTIANSNDHLVETEKVIPHVKNDVEFDLTSPGQSSGYQSFNFHYRSQDAVIEDSSFFSKDVQDDLEFWSLMREDLESIKTITQIENEAAFEETVDSSSATIGLFLETLVKSVDGWLNNSIEVNLALCSILSRLASYPQPLLQSLILNPYLILQPSIPGLVSSIATLKQRIDSALNANENALGLIEEARFSLQSRLPYSAKMDSVNTSATKSTTKHRPSSRLAGLFSSMVRKDPAESMVKDVLHYRIRSNGAGNQPEGELHDPIGNHVAMCAVLLEEWLYELAAISMEHAVHFTPISLPLTKL